jgi:hypothetical protein
MCEIVVFDGETFAVGTAMLRTGRKRTLGKTLQNIGGAAAALTGVYYATGRSWERVAVGLAAIPAGVLGGMTVMGLNKWASSRMAGMMIPVVCKDVDVAFRNVSAANRSLELWGFVERSLRLHCCTCTPPPITNLIVRCFLQIARIHIHFQVRRELLKGVEGKVRRPSSLSGQHFLLEE